MQQDEKALALVQSAMGNTDQRIAQDKPVTPAFILAALLWPVVSKQFNRLEGNGEAPMVAMHTAAQSAIAGVMRHISIPRRFSQPMRENWQFQLRMQRDRVARQPNWSSIVVFGLPTISSCASRQGDTGELGRWWTAIQELPRNNVWKKWRLHRTTASDQENPDTPIQAHMTPAYIALGSNLRRPQNQLQKAVAALEVLPDTRLVRVSSIYRSAAVGPGTQPDYLNAVLLLDTKLSPLALLHAMQHIEQEQGRVRDIAGAPHSGSRLLLYGEVKITHRPHRKHLECTNAISCCIRCAKSATLICSADGSDLDTLLRQCPMNGLVKPVTGYGPANARKRLVQ
jgi:poly(A) polymerase